MLRDGVSALGLLHLIALRMPLGREKNFAVARKSFKSVCVNLWRKLKMCNFARDNLVVILADITIGWSLAFF